MASSMLWLILDQRHLIECCSPKLMSSFMISHSSPCQSSWWLGCFHETLFYGEVMSVQTPDHSWSVYRKVCRPMTLRSWSDSHTWHHKPTLVQDKVSKPWRTDPYLQPQILATFVARCRLKSWRRSARIKSLTSVISLWYVNHRAGVLLFEDVFCNFSNIFWDRSSTALLR